MEIVPILSLSLHPESLKTPKMTPEQYEALKLSLEVNGQIDPILVFRKRIVDGRHRWLALQELNVTTIKIKAMPNNSTLEDIKSMVRIKETRRHESVTQLAISAYNFINSKEGINVTQEEASKQFGVPRKRIGEVKKIAVGYNRPDIIELLFNGGKFNTGSQRIPFWTDSLGTIVAWLSSNSTVSFTENIVGVKPRTELTDDERVIVNQFMNSLMKESTIVQEEIANMTYRIIKEKDENIKETLSSVQNTTKDLN